LGMKKASRINIAARGWHSVLLILALKHDSKTKYIAAFTVRDLIINIP
jgi:hypothetical protein